MRDILSSRIQKLERTIINVESKLNFLAICRLTSFILVIILGILLYTFQIDILISLGLCGVLVALFYLSVFLYNQWNEYKDKLESKLLFLEREISRTERNSKLLFRRLPINEDKIKVHPYAADLNIFDGLFPLLDTTSTESGERLFIENLLQDNTLSQENISSNQDLVRKLSKNKWFSYKFLRIASEGWEFPLGNKWSTSDWRNPKSNFFTKRHLLKQIYPLYSIIGCSLIISAILFQSPFGAPIFLLNLILFIGYRRESVKEFNNWESAYSRLTNVSRLLKLIIRNYESSLLKNNEIEFIDQSLKKFGKSINQLTNSPLIHFLANTFYLHDLWKFSQLLNWQDRFQDRTLKWIEMLEEVDSLHPLIHLSFIHFGFHFPKIDNSLIAIQGRGLRHPLIQEEYSVSNPIDLWECGKVLLITGSNMSGKTTYLRTVGTNVLLGLMGGPVLAESLEFPPMKIVCSVKNQDSLTEGISLFYSEVKRLAQIFQSMDENPTIHLILLDEILKGTNTKERFIASKEILNKLGGKIAYTVCTTHDLELAKIPGILLKHFTETISDNKMSFDYKIRDGVVETTNAIFILKKEGVIS